MPIDNFATQGFKKLLSITLPKGETNHLLILGDEHNKSWNFEVLKDHLPQLVKQNVKSIAIEAPLFMNILVWGYRDKVFEKEGFNKADARAQLKKMIRDSSTDFNFPDALEKQMDLMLSAVDAGITPICYDIRHSLREVSKRSVGQQAIKWLNSNPEYKIRLELMEKIKSVGIKQKINHDALSATLLNALSPDQGNQVLVIGAGHLDGVGFSRLKTDGTFIEHLETLQSDKKPVITKVMIATPAVMKEYTSRDKFVRAYASLIVETHHQLQVFDLNTGKVTPWVPPETKYVGLSEKLMVPWYMGSAKSELEVIKKRINPLLSSEIKQLTVSLHKQIYGPVERAPAR